MYIAIQYLVNLCVCVCVCVREREGEGERVRESERECERVYVCVVYGVCKRAETCNSLDRCM